MPAARRAREHEQSDQESEGEQQQPDTSGATHFDRQGNPLEEKEFYCPGCGRRYSYMRECTGTFEAPHPPIELVPTSELKGNPADLTAAPDTEHLG